MANKADLEKTSREVLDIIRNELFLDMPYLIRALGEIKDVMDLSTHSIGTDGAYIRFNPAYVFENYMSRPGRLNRAYMHMLLHNLLGHPWGIPKRQFYKDEESFREDLWLYNIACDVTVEFVIDSMDVDGLRVVSDDFRDECYDKLSEHIRTFTAQRLFAYFKEQVVDGKEVGNGDEMFDDKLEGNAIGKTNDEVDGNGDEEFGNKLDGKYMTIMENKFVVCDHSFWEKLFSKEDENSPPDIPDYNEMPITNLPLKESWEKVAEAVRLEAERSGSEKGNDSGKLTWSLKLHTGSRYDYGSLLSSLMIRREVVGIDPDAFDIAYYTYGMEMYGNMPLIEELEGREEKRLDNIVIAIDTSASTKAVHVKKFLNETYTLLSKSDVFFENADILILECDDVVQKEVHLKRPEEFKNYIDSFEVSGGYGTSFIPVFTRLRDMRQSGELKRLRALLYFTDGYGDYPQKATSYKTIFVFLEDEDYDDTSVPDWAGKVYIR